MEYFFEKQRQEFFNRSFQIVFQVNIKNLILNGLKFILTKLYPTLNKVSNSPPILSTIYIQSPLYYIVFKTFLLYNEDVIDIKSIFSFAEQIADKIL